MKSKKISILFLNFCCNLNAILAIFTQTILFFLSLVINFYSNKLLALQYQSLTSYLLWLFFLLIIFLAFIALFFFIFRYKKFYIPISLIVTSLIFLNTSAYADDTIIISSDTPENKIIPFSQFVEPSLSKDISQYTELATAHNLSTIVGKNAGTLDQSYSLLHQIVAASRLDSSNSNIAVVSTDAFIKYEVVYISEVPLTQTELTNYLIKLKTPIIWKTHGSTWIMSDLQSNRISDRELKAYSSTILNNFLHDADFFPKSNAGTFLRALRLGDMIAFESNTFNVLHSTEFKSSQSAVDVNNVNSAFGKRFFKSTLVDNQLFDSINKKFYYKSCGDFNAKLLEINNSTIDDKALTEKFKLGRKLATNIQYQSTLKFNIVSYTLNNFLKIIK